MNKKIIYAIAGVGALSSLSLGVVGVVNSDVNLAEKAPRAGEETIIVEDTEAEVEAPIEEVVAIEEEKPTFEEAVPHWKELEPRLANLYRYIYENENPTFKAALNVYFSQEFERFGAIDCGDNFDECIVAIRTGEFRNQPWFNEGQFIKFYGTFYNAMNAQNKNIV